MCRIMFILLGLIVFSSCSVDRREGGRLGNEYIKVHRYDRLEYEAAMFNSMLAMQRMNTEWSHATRLLMEDVLDLGPVDQPDINGKFCAYFNDSILVALMKDVDVEYRDLSDIEDDLTDGFAKLEKEIPFLPVPRVYSQISALNQSVVVSDSILGISLDKYMGADYPLYKRYYYPNQRRFMSRDRIVPDCFTFYLLGQYPFRWEESHRTLFDLLMHRGLVAWIVDKILGSDKPGKISLGYTDEEVKWCRDNREELWKWMSESHYLLSTDPMVIRSYISPDVSVNWKDRQLPPSIGVWMGICLIDRFIGNHKDLSWKVLLERADFREILLQEKDVF